MAENVSESLKLEIEGLIQLAYRTSADVAEEVESILKEGWERPLSREDATRLLSSVIGVLQRKSRNKGGKTATAVQGDVEQVVARMVAARERVQQDGPAPPAGRKKLALLPDHNGVKPSPVRPTPLFHGLRVQMDCGYIKTTELSLWPENDRLEVHLQQFRQVNEGREPTDKELLNIMLSKGVLPGLTEEDQFDIDALARSISINGVRKPPILAVDGTVLDGNRRLAACLHILANPDKFSLEERRRVEHLFVWQLTEHAGPDEIQAVVVSLNFESDYKIEWPKYVKARKVYHDWQGMLLLNPGASGETLTKMKQEITKKYGLGPRTFTLADAIKMVTAAQDFENYHIMEKGRDTYEVKHQSARRFDYFDELTKGAVNGGVAQTLARDEVLKAIVYDLLLADRFKNWELIRSLKYANQEVRDNLAKARDMADDKAAKQLVEDTLNKARLEHAEAKAADPNPTVLRFYIWLKKQSMADLREKVTPQNKARLVDALRVAERMLSYEGIEDGEVAE